MLFFPTLFCAKKIGLPCFNSKEKEINITEFIDFEKGVEPGSKNYEKKNNGPQELTHVLNKWEKTKLSFMTAQEQYTNYKKTLKKKGKKKKKKLTNYGKRRIL